MFVVSHHISYIILDWLPIPSKSNSNSGHLCPLTRGSVRNAELSSIQFLFHHSLFLDITVSFAGLLHCGVIFLNVPNELNLYLLLARNERSTCSALYIKFWSYFKQTLRSFLKMQYINASCCILLSHKYCTMCTFIQQYSNSKNVFSCLPICQKVLS